MSEMINEILITCYGAIWLPSIAAILGIVATFLKVRSYIAKISRDARMDEVERLLKEVLKKNDALSKENRILIDSIKGVRDYVDKI
jgi:hypothetical protein